MSEKFLEEGMIVKWKKKKKWDERQRKIVKNYYNFTFQMDLINIHFLYQY